MRLQPPEEARALQSLPGAVSASSPGLRGRRMCSTPLQSTGCLCVRECALGKRSLQRQSHLSCPGEPRLPYSASCSQPALLVLFFFLNFFNVLFIFETERDKA